MILGICLTLAAQFLSAGQNVLEETFVRSRNFHVLAVAGMEVQAPSLGLNLSSSDTLT